MSKEVVLGFVRQLLTAVGPFLVAQGFVDEETVGVIIGSVITIVGLVWGVVDKSGELGPSIISIARHSVGALSGVFVATGLLDEGTLGTATTLALAAVAFGGSFLNKQNRARP